MSLTPETFVERLGREKASAILRTDDQETAARAMEAALNGGFRIIEFTLTIPGVFELIREFSRRDGLVVEAWREGEKRRAEAWREGEKRRAEAWREHEKRRAEAWREDQKRRAEARRRKASRRAEW